MIDALVRWRREQRDGKPGSIKWWRREHGRHADGPIPRVDFDCPLCPDFAEVGRRMVWEGYNPGPMSYNDALRLDPHIAAARKAGPPPALPKPDYRLLMTSRCLAALDRP